VNLPSSDSAKDLVNGVPGSLERVAMHTLGRTAIIAAGLAVSARLGLVDDRNIIKKAFISAVSIEIAALAFMHMAKSAPAVKPGNQSI